MKDKVVIITGGSSGIGKACAETLGKAGAKIIFTGRNQKRIDTVRQNLDKYKVENMAIKMDVSNEQDCRNVVEHAINSFGKIDILINNAGISMRALFEDLDLEVFKRVMEINFYGSVYMAKYALPYLLKTRGTIVGVSSINGRRTTPARIAYNASKFAIEGFYETLRMEVMTRGVHVLVVSPGFTASNIRNAALNENGIAQGESPRDESSMMRAEDVAREIKAGILKKKRDIVLTTQGKMLVLVNKFMPGLVDKIVYRYMSREPDSPLR